MTRSKSIRILCLGDIVARPGRTILTAQLTGLCQKHKVDLVIANAENAAGGSGLEPKTAHEIQSAGVDVITLGDHTWRRKELRNFLDSNEDWCIRPANFPAGAEGRGWTIWEGPGALKVGILNLLGRVFIPSPLDCPFNKARELLENPLSECPIIVCDFHAEATSEKMAMGRYLDGKISLLVGTHTHVATADTRIFPEGTGYVTDLGMCGSVDGVIGMDTVSSLERFLSGMPHAYKAAGGSALLQGIVAEVDTKSGKCLAIERVEASS